MDDGQPGREMSPHERGELAVQSVAEFMAKIDPGSFAGRFVLIVEVMQEDGDRVMWTFTPNEQKSWESLGLMMQGIHLEQAYTTMAELRDDE